MRTLARRWLMLNEEVCDLDRQLKSLVEEKAPTLLASYGISTMTIAEMLTSSGVKHRFRLNRGGNRQANAALYRVAIVRMRSHKPTLDYVKKRTKDGKSKSEIIRCLKRFIVREIYQHICRQNPC
jgi:transposase